MTTTSQSGEGKEPTGSAPTGNEPSSKESQAVPLGEFIELRKELRKVSEELAKTKEQLAKPKEAEPKADPKAPSVETLHKQLQEIQAKNARDAIRAELGLQDDKQVDKVMAIVNEKGLAPHEALALAAIREPDTFQGFGRVGSGDLQYGSLTPRPGSSPQPKPNDAVDRKKYIDSLKGKDELQRGRYLDNLAGAHLAQAMGWEHKLLDLPNQQ